MKTNNSKSQYFLQKLKENPLEVFDEIKETYLLDIQENIVQKQPSAQLDNIEYFFERELVKLSKRLKKESFEMKQLIEAYLEEKVTHYIEFHLNDTEAEWKEELKRGDRNAIEKLYKKCYKPIHFLIIRLGGTSDDAKDIFQVAIKALLDNLKSPQFSLDVKVINFLKPIARNMWLTENKKDKLKPISADEMVFDIVDKGEESIEQKKLKEIKLNLIEKCLKQLETSQMQLITAKFLDGLSHLEIANKFGIQGQDDNARRNNARQRFHTAMTNLKNIIANDLDFRSLL